MAKINNKENNQSLDILKDLEIVSEKQSPYFGSNWLATLESDPDRHSMTWGFNDQKMMPIEDELLLELEGQTPKAINVYKKLLTDQSVSAIWGKIVHEICGKEINVQPFRKDANSQPEQEAIFIAKALEKQIESMKFDSMCKALLEALITGISIVELKWERQPYGAHVYDFKYIEARRIQFNTMWEPYLITKDDPNLGKPLKKYQRNFIIHRFYQVPCDSPYGNGLGRQLYHPVLFLRRAMESWLLAADRFSTPLILAKVSDEATPEERRALARRLTNLSREKFIMMPKEWDIDFIQPNARADFYEKQISMYSDMISRLIAGETTTGEASDVGSYGRDAISKSILMSRAAYLSRQLDETLNDQFVRSWVDINFGKNVPAPKLERRMFDLRTELPLQDAMSILGYGIPLSIDWMAETYKFEYDQETWRKGGTAGGVTVPPHPKEIEVTDNVFQDLGWE